MICAAVGQERKPEFFRKYKRVLARLIAVIIVVIGADLVARLGGGSVVIVPVTCRQYGGDQCATCYQQCCEKKERFVFTLNFFHNLLLFFIFTAA